MFPNRPAILPVIHIRDFAQARESARIAQDTGADGVWLIDHEPRGTILLQQIHAKIKESYPELWIGVNFLRLDPLDIISNILGLNHQALWIDSFGINSENNSDKARRIARAFNEAECPALLFAGTAFKYQPPIYSDELSSLTNIAGQLLSKIGVVTTSGPATGLAPEVAKITTMSEAAKIHNCPLAIASGMTPENISQFVPYVDAFLVGTSLEDPRTGHLIPEELYRLMVAAGRA